MNFKEPSCWDYVKVEAHIDLSEEQAAIVFHSDRIEFYLSPQAMAKEEPTKAAYVASMCAIFLQQPEMVEAVMRLMEQELK